MTLQTVIDKVRALSLPERFELFEFLRRDECLKAYRAVDADAGRAQLHQRERAVKRRAAQAEHARSSRERKQGTGRRLGAMTVEEFLRS